MTDEFTHMVKKTASMLNIVAADIISDLIGKFNMSDSEIRAAVKTVSVNELEDFTEEYPDLSLQNNMVLVYLIILRQQMGIDSKRYDC